MTDDKKSTLATLRNKNTTPEITGHAIMVLERFAEGTRIRLFLKLPNVAGYNRIVMMTLIGGANRMSEYTQAQQYQDFLKSVNRELPDDEYAALAAYDALTAEYNLDRYPTPSAWERLERASTTAQTGGVFLSCGGDSPCRV